MGGEKGTNTDKGYAEGMQAVVFNIWEGRG